MTFLEPVAGIVAAGLAGPALLLMYFLKLRRRPVRVSSTLLWDQAARDVQVNVPLRWLKPAWSLLLQALALGCLVLAVARPGTPEDGPTGPVIVLIDRSASMSALDGKPEGGEARASRLDEAKRRALEIIEQARRRGRSSPVMVAEFAATAASLTPFTTDRATLREAVAGITPTDQPGDLAGAMRLLETLAESAVDAAESPERASPPMVMVLSDGAFRRPERPLIVRGLSLRLVRVGGARTAETPGPNVGIVSLAALRDHEDPATVRVLARVQNAGGERASVPVRLSVDGQDVEARTVEVPAAEAGTAGADPRGGETTAAFTFPSTRAGVVVVSLAGADLLAADDSAALTLEAPSRPRVLVIGPGGATPIDPFLMSALRVIDLGGLETGDPGTYARLAAGASTEGRAGGTPAPGLAGFDLIVFDRFEPRAAPDRPTLSIGAGLRASGVVLEPGEAGRATRVLTWERRHAVLRHVALDGVVIDEPGRLTLPEPTPAREVKALAVGADGPLMAAVDEGSTRRLVLGFELARTTLGTSVALPVLLAQAVDYLTLRGEAGVGRSVDTTRTVSLVPAAGATRIALDGPVRLEAAVEPGRERVWLGPLERAGLYAVAGAAAGTPPVAVNLGDEWESLAGLRDELDAVGANPTAGGAAGGERPVREWWPWLLGAALVLLAAEWLVFARSMRV